MNAARAASWSPAAPASTPAALSARAPAAALAGPAARAASTSRRPSGTAPRAIQNRHSDPLSRCAVSASPAAAAHSAAARRFSRSASSRRSQADLVRALEPALGSLGQGERPRRVARRDRVRLARLAQPLAGELVDGLEHPEPLSRAHDERAVDERLELVEHVARHRLRALQRPAAGEHGELREQRSLALLEQVVAPLDRGAQGALPRGRVARPAGQQVEPAPEPLEDRGG